MTTRTPRRRLTRRQFLGRSGLALGGLAVAPSLLTSACGGDDDGDSASANELYFANWPLYIDEETVPAFEDETGIEMRYTEEYNDNLEYFARIQPVLSAGRTIEPDLIAPTDWMAERLIRLGWVDQLPLDDVPNKANLRAQLLNPTWDPSGEYTLPWQSGMTGIAYNRRAAGRDLTSIEDLFDPAFRGRIGMLLEFRDTVALLMVATGADPIEPTFAAAQPAFDKLAQANDEGQIRAFTGNDYQDDLVAGNFVACIGWSGDVAQLALENDDLVFVIPEEGGMLWSDTMVMPKGARHVDAVAAWLDYVYEPVNAARITAWVQYMSPVEGVQDELRRLGGEAAALAESPFLFPDQATLDRLTSFGPLTEEDEAAFEERMAEIIGA